MNAFKRYFDVYRGLPSSLYMLFFATIINSMGMFVFPFLTLYLTGRLGMSQEKAGFFIMMLYLVYGPASLIGGKLADSFGRKKLMVIAQVLSGLCYIPCGFPTVASSFGWNWLDHQSTYRWLFHRPFWTKDGLAYTRSHSSSCRFIYFLFGVDGKTSQQKIID